MDGTTLCQFKKLFPASAVSSKLSTGKISITLKLKNFWGNNTLDDLSNACLPIWYSCSRLHLEKIGDGSVAVHWLCSTIDALKIAIFEATNSLKTKGVLQVFIVRGWSQNGTMQMGESGTTNHSCCKIEVSDVIPSVLVVAVTVGTACINLVA